MKPKIVTSGMGHQSSGVYDLAKQRKSRLGSSVQNHPLQGQRGVLTGPINQDRVLPKTKDAKIWK